MKRFIFAFSLIMVFSVGLFAQTLPDYWNVKGNPGLTTMNFLGTIDTMPIIIKTNNNEIARFDAKARLGIGVQTPSANFDVNGSFAARVTNISSTYTVQPSDYTLSVQNGSSAITITLPPANAATRRIIPIKRYNTSSTGTITINAISGLIESQTGTFAATTTLGTAATNRRAIFQSDGLNWIRLM